VDATNGNDDNDGFSPSTAWKTIEKADVSNFKLEDSILFMAGDVQRENSKLKSPLTMFFSLPRGFRWVT
jgi:hypothetical protein